MNGDRRWRKLLLLLRRGVVRFGGGGSSTGKGGGGGVAGGRGVGVAGSSVSNSIGEGEGTREGGATGGFDEDFVDESEPPIDHLLGRAGAIVVGHVKHLNARRFYFRRAVGGLADTHQSRNVVMLGFTQVLRKVAVARGIHKKKTEFLPDDKGGFAG